LGSFHRSEVPLSGNQTHWYGSRQSFTHTHYKAMFVPAF
jgi:hypothetical protein